MKKTIAILSILAVNVAFSQIKLPNVSSEAEVEQKIGYTEVEVEYSRPNLNKRTAFGTLVPFGEIWRTGANKNTTIEFSQEVSIENKVLEKGTYAIFTIPNKKTWEVIFYKNTENWGAPKQLVDSLVAAKVTVPSLKNTEVVETFTIGFKDVTIDNANLYFAWDKTQVQVNIKTQTLKQAEEIIKNELNEKSSAYDFFKAASYYYSNNIDMKKAQEWINIAIEKDPKTPFFKDYKAKIDAAVK